MTDLTTLKLSELRELYPGIVTNSKKKFLGMLKDKEDKDSLISEVGVISPEPPSMGDSIINSPIADTKEHEIVGGNLPGNDAESIAEARYLMQIRENIPKYILEHLYKIAGCECPADAYAKFRDTNFAMRRVFQHDLIKWYKELFKESIRTTSCSKCWHRRIRRFRSHLSTKIID